MLKIYGSPRSSAGRCYLLLEELGVAYETMPLDMSKKEHKSEAFLKLNPNGKVPCLVDGDFVIWESIAINHYLCEKYRPELLGSNPQEKGLVQQWNLWSMLDLQAPMVEILIQKFFTPEEKRSQTMIDSAMEKIPLKLSILDKSLKGKRYLVGDTLTVADMNVASVVNITAGLGISLDSYPAVSNWFAAIKDRPSFQKFAALR